MIILIGHITHDHIITPNIDLHIPGGTVWYAGWALHHLMISLPEGYPSVPFHLITSVGSSDQSSIDQLAASGINVHNIPSPSTVYFENRYGENMNNRQQRVLSCARPFTWEILEPEISRLLETDTSEPIFLLGSLLADDFSLDLLRRLHKLGKVVVDVQGYLREVVGEEVRAVDWTEKLDAFPYIDVLKTNEYEMEVLTGLTDPLLAARQLCHWGVGEVLLTFGDLGSIIVTASSSSSSTSHVQIPAFPPHPLVDATGCGDTYTTAFILRRAQGASVADAGRFAAATATLKLQHSGPFRGSFGEVLEMAK